MRKAPTVALSEEVRERLEKLSRGRSVEVRVAERATIVLLAAECRSGKTGDDLGRWGLGKTVYRAVSRVGCMLGLTLRHSDRRRLLMGQCVLQIHRHDGREYMPEGYWCGAQNAKELPLPIQDVDELARFSSEWRLTRKDEPGLSVVAPYVPEELKAERVLQAVIVHFFTRILRGDLVVEVSGQGIGSVRLDEKEIEAACKLVGWGGPKRTKRHAPPPIKFAKSALADSRIVESRPLGETRLPELNEECFAAGELELLRSRFASVAT